LEIGRVSEPVLRKIVHIHTDDTQVVKLGVKIASHLTDKRRSGRGLNENFEKSNTMGRARHIRGTRRRSYVQIPAGARGADGRAAFPAQLGRLGDRERGTRMPFLSRRSGIHPGQLASAQLDLRGFTGEEVYRYSELGAILVEANRKDRRTSSGPYVFRIDRHHLPPPIHFLP